MFGYKQGGLCYCENVRPILINTLTIADKIEQLVEMNTGP